MADEPRRASGESSIAQGSDGHWDAYVSMGAATGGRRDRRHVSGGSRREVLGKVRALEKQRDAGVVPEAGKPPTVEEWLTLWLAGPVALRVRPLTLATYRGYVRNRIIPAIGRHRLDRLQPEHLEHMYVDLGVQGLAPASVLQCHRIVSRALKVALQRGKVARNVATLVDAPSFRRAEVVPLSATEAKQLLAAAEGTRNAARWAVALALGLRQGEALGLPWSAVDLAGGTIKVKQALQRRTGMGLVIDEPKSPSSKGRTIVLPAILTEAMRAHRIAQAEERLLGANTWRNDLDLVFTNQHGRPIDPTVDHRAWKALLRAAGVRDARLHDARHTAATLMLVQGVPARVVMEVLGHSQISLTLGTYSHVVPELQDLAAEAMGRALWA